MNRHIKRIALLLALLQLLFAVVSCQKKPDDPTPSDENSVEVTKELLASYTIVYPDKCSDECKQLASSLRTSIKELTGTELEIKSDFVAEGSDVYREAEYEILLGKADRKEADRFYRNIRSEDTGYAVVGKKILLLGYHDAELKTSLSRFRTDILNKRKNEPVLLCAENNLIAKGTYLFDSLLLNGIEINQYTVVYPKASSLKEKDIAANLIDWIAGKTGYVLTVTTDAAEPTEYEIQIGNTNRITADMSAERDRRADSAMYYLASGNNLVWFSGSTFFLLRFAFLKFCGLMTGTAGTATLQIGTPIGEKPKELPLSVMSYNVYYDLTEPNRDPEGVLTSIEERNPDIFNTVETTAGWFTKLEGKFGSTYTCIKGKPVDSSNDPVYNAIFYRKDQFVCKESGTKWLSNTPDVESKFSISKHYKHFTYAILKEKATGIEFLYISIHLDYSDNDDKYKANSAECRRQQALVLKAFLEKYPFMPVIVGGDFNAKASTEAIRVVVNQTRLSDSASIAKQSVRNSTSVPNFTTLPDNNVIDYLFVTDDCITAQKYEAWDNKINGRYPSDHIPVCAEITVFSL